MKQWQLLMAVWIASCGFLEGSSLTASSAIEENYLRRFRRNGDSTTCVLQPQPAHGRYSIVGETAIPIPGKSVKEFTFLEINCLPNYALNSAQRVFCSEGKWSAENITCLKTCKPLISSTIQYDCIFNGVQVSCNKPTAAGTKAFLSCKENNKPVQLPGETISCLENGEWEHSFVICTPECGRTPIGSKFAINAYKAHQHQFPWHAAIYDKENSIEPNVPDFICGGTIVSSNKIVSAAHCFWDGKEDQARSAEAFAVGYGKEFSDFNNNDDMFAVYTSVKQLLIHPDYHDILQSYAQDIGVVVLSNVIEFNHIIKPICIDWSDDNEDNLEPGDLGKVPGWGKITEEGAVSPQLMQLNMPVVSKRTCRRKSPKEFLPYITYDKICAGFENGSSLCHGDSGGGLIFYDDSKNAFYLKGIVSTGPVLGNLCDSYKYTLFTSVVYFLPWLQEQKVHREPEVFTCTSGKSINIQDKCDGTVDCDDDSDESKELCTKTESTETSDVLTGSCILPAKPGNGSYTVYGSETGLPAWTPTKHGTILEYKCNKKYVLTSKSTVECFEGQWLPSLPTCKKPCQPLEQRDGTSLECKFDKTLTVSCNDPIAPGTDVIINCYSGFTRPDNFFRILTCTEDSTWNFPLVYCKTECGITHKVLNLRDNEAIINEIKDKYGEEYLKVASSPWSVHIYEKIPGATPVLVCGGTMAGIVFQSSTAIVTERRCLTDAEGNLRDPASFAVGLAKLYDGWQDERDKFAFYSDIKHVGFVKAPYRTAAINSNETVAFLLMKETVPISYLIRPACINYQARFVSEAQFEIPSLNDNTRINFDFTAVQSENVICPNQTGRGIISRTIEQAILNDDITVKKLLQELFRSAHGLNVTAFAQLLRNKHYLIGVLSLDQNKELPCRSGSFNAIPVDYIF